MLEPNGAEDDLAKEPVSFRERLNALPFVAKLLMLLVAIILLGVVGNAVDTGSSGAGRGSGSGSSGSSRPYLVVYEVAGDGAPRASLTYENDTGGTEQHEVRLPWNETYRGFEEGDFVYISAQNEGEVGSVRCVVKVNGLVKYESTSSGAYSICSASGILPP